MKIDMIHDTRAGNFDVPIFIRRVLIFLINLLIIEIFSFF